MSKVLPAGMTVEILFTCWNRKAYSRASMQLLKQNTDWSRVSRLVVYDDGSEDGTFEAVRDIGATIGVPAFEMREGGWRSIGATMNDYVALTESEWFVKIDNDIAVPPGWLERLLYVSDGYDLVGMEAAFTSDYRGLLAPGYYSVQKARHHIGGVGLMRTQAFVHRRPVPLSKGRNGFTIWQHRNHLRVGWITPDLPAVQLDRIPQDPWQSLAADYCMKGWSRPWEPYGSDMSYWWSWIPRDVARKAAR